MLACHLVQIEGMERLSKGVQQIVGGIHHVIDWPKADGLQRILHPFRGFLHRDASDGNAGVAGTSGCVLHVHFHRTAIVVHLEGGYIWFAELILAWLMVLEVCREVARHTVMGGRVDTVRGDVHLDHIVGLDAVICLGQCAHWHVRRQFDDARMASSDTDLVLGAEHSVRIHATELEFGDGGTFVAFVQLRTEGGDDGFDPCTAVSGAAHDLQGFALTNVDFRNMKVVGVRMRHAFQYFTHY